MRKQKLNKPWLDEVKQKIHSDPKLCWLAE